MRFLVLLTVLCGLAADLPAAEMQVARNIAYRGKEGHAVRHRLDVYAPEKGEDLPVMVWVHGGAWKFGNKRAVNNKPEWFTSTGFVMVSINYRLHPDADYANQAADVAGAIAWVRENIAEHSGDPDRIFLMGHSAGAHLAALVGTDHHYLDDAEVPVASIAGVVLLDGAGYDIPLHMKSAKRQLKSLYENVFSTDEESQRKASPITYVEKEIAYPPFLILHCTSRAASTEQSETLGRRLEEAGGEATVYAAKGKTHMTINREIGLEGDGPTDEIAKFLKQQTVVNEE